MQQQIVVDFALCTDERRASKDNDCLPTDAIVRLINLGRAASKAELAAQRKARRGWEIARVRLTPHYSSAATFW